MTRTQIPAVLRQRRSILLLAGFVVVVAIGIIIDRVGANLPSLLKLATFAMTPYLLMTVGMCLNQKAGLINIGMEGTLLLSALFSAFAADYVGSTWGGVLIGMAAGALMGLIFGLVSTQLKADQIIVGLGIIFFAAGLAPFLLRAWSLPGLFKIPDQFRLPTISTPIGHIPVLLFVAIAIAVLAHLLLHRTLLGIKIKITGERPEAADVAGVRVNRIRISMSMIQGTLGGLAGAFLVLGWFGSVTNLVSGGRGFIALAITIFAVQEPLMALFGSFLFGFFEGFAHWAAQSPFMKTYLPPELSQSIPFIIPIIILALLPRRASGPSAMARPYIRE
ncbi:MAG: ABC transporter permease [Candidatus Bipolaricaulia bacterium]